MRVDLNDDMTPDNLRFFTADLCAAAPIPAAWGTLSFIRKLYYVLSDEPTDAASLLDDTDDGAYKFGYDYDNLLWLLIPLGLLSN